MIKDIKFKIRDLRKKEQFMMDDTYLNGYAKKCGIYATGVYLSLCRHANKDQKCWPSIRKMAEELNISSVMVQRGLKILCECNIIQKEQLGKGSNNRYYLIDKSDWSSVSHDDTLSTSVGVSPQISQCITTDTRCITTDKSIVRIPNKDTQSKDIAEQSSAGNEINELIDLFKQINLSYSKFFGNKTQRSAIGRLLKLLGRQKLELYIKILPETNSKQYYPKITTPLSLEDKLAALQLAMERDNLDLVYMPNEKQGQVIKEIENFRCGFGKINL